MATTTRSAPRRGAAARPRNDEAELAARELLKHLDHPARLRANALAKPYFVAANSPEGDRLAAERIRSVVAGAVARLWPRDALIVRRCDIDGELHRTVARELLISERHLYRLRQSAVRRIVHALRTEAGAIVESVSAPLDPPSVALLAAEGFARAGDCSRAIEALESALPSLADPLDRLWFEWRLSALHSGAGTYEGSAQHVERAASYVATVEPERREIGANAVDVARAALFASLGELPSLDGLLRTAVPAARRNAAQTTDWRSLHATATALLLASERHLELNRLVEASGAAREALEVLRFGSGYSAGLRIHARLCIESARLFDPQQSASAAIALRNLASDAADQALVPDAMLISALLATMHRARGKPTRALAELRPLLPILRRVCAGSRNLAVILVEAARAHAAVGQFADAHELATEALATAAGSPHAAAYAEFCLAEFALARRDANLAIDHAESAGARFDRIGNYRLAAGCLRISAQGFEQRRDHRRAVRTIERSLELMRYAYPSGLADTLEAAAAITRDPRHAVAARRVRATLRR